MNKLVEQMEKDQTEVIDNTSNIKTLADEVKKLRSIEDEIKHFLKTRMYNNKSVLVKNNKGKKIIKNLFKIITKKPKKFINSSDRKYVDLMLNAIDYIDLIIPRGGAQLVNMVREKSRVPAITGGIGVCHIYVDETADKNKAIEIIYNSKVQRPSVCNALDTVIFNENINKDIIISAVKKLLESKVEVRVDTQCFDILSSLKEDYPDSICLASDDDWGQEFLSLILSIRITDSIENAIKYINQYGGHSEAIISENPDNTTQFLKAIDSSAVFVNASTRFNDGGELGLGAEVAISTSKIHARGPMGIKDLTSYKWIIIGEGQIRN